VIDRAAPFAEQVPAKANELTVAEGARVPPPAADTSAASPIQRLQRKEATPDKSIGDQAGELILEGRIKESEPDVPPPAPGEGFWSGVWRHLKASGNHFLQNWKTTLISLIYSLLLFYPVLLQEGPKLWNECKQTIFGGGGVDRFDHVLGVLRHLVNIVAGLVATTGIWALIIGAFTGLGEVIVAGAYEAVSLAVIGADVALGFAEMGKAWYSATRDGISAQTRETYLSMFGGSVISTAITIVLVILGAVASRLAKAFKTRRPLPPGEDVKGGGGETKGGDAGGEKKGGEAGGDKGKVEDNAKAGGDKPKTTPNGLPLSDPVNTSEMARAAVKRSLEAPPAERAALYDLLRKDIEAAAKGTWKATPGTGTQGEKIFIGSQGRTLVFTREGAMWVGDINACPPVVEAGKIRYAPDYSKFKKLE
jgi:hypothetical protein